MWNETEVTCPYCFERVTLLVEPDVEGRMVQDCEVCCNPWQVTVTRDRRDPATTPRVRVERLQ